MPKQARHAARLVLVERGYTAVGGGPVTWGFATHPKSSRRPTGVWSGYFEADRIPGAIFDLTQWLDRGQTPEVVRYSYQVRYCNGLRQGARWQYRLDFHPLTDPLVVVPHYHDQAATDAEHSPHVKEPYLSLAQALPILEQQLLTRNGECSDEPPGIRGLAPHQPPAGARRTTQPR